MKTRKKSRILPLLMVLALLFTVLFASITVAGASYTGTFSGSNTAVTISKSGTYLVKNGTTFRGKNGSAAITITSSAKDVKLCFEGTATITGWSPGSAWDKATSGIYLPYQSMSLSLLRAEGTIGYPKVTVTGGKGVDANGTTAASGGAAGIGTFGAAVTTSTTGAGGNSADSFHSGIDITLDQNLDLNISGGRGGEPAWGSNGTKATTEDKMVIYATGGAGGNGGGGGGGEGAALGTGGGTGGNGGAGGSSPERNSGSKWAVGPGSGGGGGGQGPDGNAGGGGGGGGGSLRRGNGHSYFVNPGSGGSPNQKGGGDSAYFRATDNKYYAEQGNGGQGYGGNGGAGGGSTDDVRIGNRGQNGGSAGRSCSEASHVTYLPRIYSITLTFDPGEGSGIAYTQVIENKKDGKYSLPDFTFTPPADYEFAGWYWNDKSDKLYNPGQTVDYKNISEDSGRWTAAYKPLPKANIEYRPGGGQGSMPGQQVLLGTSFRLPECRFTRPGYTFVGWNTGVPAGAAGERITGIKVIGVSGKAADGEIGDNAFDGSDSTKWCDNTNGEKGWVAFKLSAPARITRMVVQHAGDKEHSVNYNTGEFALQVLKNPSALPSEGDSSRQRFLADASNWVDLVKVNNEQEKKSVTDTAVSAPEAHQIYRFNVTKGEAQTGEYPAVRIYEIELYNDNGLKPVIKQPGDMVTADKDMVITAEWNQPDFISVDVSWGSMEFTYHEAAVGTWNPQTLQYEGGSEGRWTCAEGADKIEFANRGNVPVNVSCTYLPQEPDITADFMGAEGPVNGPIGLNEGESKNVTVQLSGELKDRDAVNKTLGSITVQIHKGA